MSKRDILKFEGCARPGSARSREAGIALDDLSFVETHDCFTIAELIEYEAMGLAPEGQGARAIAEGMDREGRQAAGQSVRRAEGQGSSDRRDRRVDARAHGDAALPARPATIQVQGRQLGGIFNMGGAAVANYVSVLERIK